MPHVLHAGALQGDKLRPVYLPRRQFGFRVRRRRAGEAVDFLAAAAIGDRAARSIVGKRSHATGKSDDELAVAAGDIVAGGKQESKGFDWDVTFQPIPQLQIVTSYEHVDHQFVTSLDPSVATGTTFQYAIKDRYGIEVEFFGERTRLPAGAA